MCITKDKTSIEQATTAKPLKIDPVMRPLRTNYGFDARAPSTALTQMQCLESDHRIRAPFDVHGIDETNVFGFARHNQRVSALARAKEPHAAH